MTSTTDPLSAAQRSKIRRLSTGAAEPAEAEGELNVVPYLDIIMNVMMFVLASVTVTFTATIPTAAAEVTPRPVSPPAEALGLTALVTSEGVALKTRGGAIAPGCAGPGGGLTVPNRGGDVDLPALSACARRLKIGHENERNVAITASPDVPYRVVVSVMDALRADDQGALFPDPQLGVAR